MKLFSKEGQVLVNVTSIDIDGENIKMNAKLMNAYSTTIYLTPYELYQAKGLLKKGMVGHLFGMFRKGKHAEPAKEKAGMTFAP